MFTYHCLNPIAEKGLKEFDGNYVESSSMHADAVLVRSADMLQMEIPEEVAIIGRAGAGVNNIPLDLCAERGVVVCNTPGANANGVKELVIAGMLLASRDIVGGIEWIGQQEDLTDIGKRAEKQKKQFAGTEISGKKLGIIGLGAIGVLVANTAVALGMDVYGYDPYISVQAAWNVSRAIHHIDDMHEILRDCDYITLHVPATNETKGMISDDALALMKDGVVLLNFSRDLLVDEAAVIRALESGKLRKYVTDFATPGIARAKNTLVTPHLGASTEESEENCAVMAAQDIREYLENGNIRHSVNFPACDLGKPRYPGRIAVAHYNRPNILSKITGTFGNLGINIADFTSKSKGAYAYVIMDTEESPTPEIVASLRAIDGVIRVRVIR